MGGGPLLLAASEGSDNQEMTRVTCSKCKLQLGVEREYNIGTHERAGEVCVGITALPAPRRRAPYVFRREGHALSGMQERM
jgi:hypothetical protein